MCWLPNIEVLGKFYLYNFLFSVVLQLNYNFIKSFFFQIHSTLTNINIHLTLRSIFKNLSMLFSNILVPIQFMQ